MQEQAFRKIAGCYAGRVELLDPSDQPFYFFFCGRNILAESKVIHDRGSFAAEIAVFVDTAHQVLGNFFLFFVQVQQSELIKQHIVKAGFRFERKLLFFVVFGIIIIPHFIVGYFVVTLVNIFAHVDVIVVISAAISFGIVFVRIAELVFHVIVRVFMLFLVEFECGVFFQFFFNPLFEVLRRYLQQLHQLNLLWGKFLQEFLLKGLT